MFARLESHTDISQTPMGSWNSSGTLDRASDLVGLVSELLQTPPTLDPWLLDRAALNVSIFTEMLEKLVIPQTGDM